MNAKKVNILDYNKNASKYVLKGTANFSIFEKNLVHEALESSWHDLNFYS